MKVTTRDDLKYTKDHEWLLVEGETGTVGITDFAQGELGDIVYLELPEVGSSVTAGEVFGTIEAVKAVAELIAPVSGTVTDVNGALTEEAATVNADCYGEGWMIKIRLSDPSEAWNLLSVAEYAELTEVG
ncbi:MAG: glycine cleavage system protein GcvH [Acidobacteria bacterium]|nr:glycine cleavage system protein GcvH [Acidobacteriota bacterium]